MNNEKSNNLSTIITGIVIGAAITYLFATKNGQKLKDELLEEGKKLLEKIGENLELEEHEEKKEELQSKTKENTHEVSEKLIEDFEKTKEELEEAIPPVPQQVTQLQKKGRRFFFRRHAAES